MRILGIVNITRDSFSDGGQFMVPADAIAHGHRLLDEGAELLDLGPSSTHPDAEDVTAAQEIERLDPVISGLREGARWSLDSHFVETQRWALARGATMLNDVRGFAFEGFYPELADADADLVVMHAVAAQGRASRPDVRVPEIWPRLERFFDERLTALTRAGIDEARLVLDPGMGFFLGQDPAVSLHVLAHIARLKDRYRLRTLVSVSRKSFLQNTVGKGPEAAQAATLAAELHLAQAGVDYLRTHDVAALADAWAVHQAIAAAI